MNPIELAHGRIEGGNEKCISLEAIPKLRHGLERNVERPTERGRAGDDKSTPGGDIQRRTADKIEITCNRQRPKGNET